MSYFTVITTARTFQIEAAGIGDALERAAMVMVRDRESLLEVR